MLGKTHVAFGALFWVGGAPVIGPAVGVDPTAGQMVGGLAVACVASVLPDIDHPDALVTKGYFPGSGALGRPARLLGKLVAIPPRLVGMVARSVMGHRGGTHSFAFGALWTFGALPLYGLFAGIAAWVLAALLSVTPLGFDPSAVWEWEREHLPGAMPLVMLAVALGYLSHLVADSLNTVPAGPLLWPFSKRRFFFLPPGLRIKVDSPAEWLVRMLVILLIVAIGFGTVLRPLYDAARGEVERRSTDATELVGRVGPAGPLTLGR